MSDMDKIIAAARRTEQGAVEFEQKQASWLAAHASTIVWTLIAAAFVAGVYLFFKVL